MKIVSDINKYCKTIMGQQKIDGAVTYRLLNYCRFVEYNNVILLYNNLTKELIELTIDEFNKIKNTQDTKDDTYKYLINNWFLVPQDNDDVKLKNQLETVSKLLNKNNCIDTFIIFTTTDCNARCFYCYEAGVKKINMSEQTAIQVAEFIKHHSKGNAVNLTWFGGEPLYNSGVIDIICTQLKNNNINFRSKMTSNGYLFDKALINKSVDLWNLKRVQITLDGTEDVYNRCKNYIYKDGVSPYKKVLANIKCLAEHGIYVKIRVNLGKHNVTNIYNLVDELHFEFNTYKNVKIYASPLYENNGKLLNDSDYQAVMNNLFELEDYIDNMGMFDLPNLSKNIQTNFCFADNDGAIGITPQGKLTKCEHAIDNDLVGDIFTNTINKQLCNTWKERVTPIELCSTCAYYPTCMTLKKCAPSTARPCNSLEQKRQLRLLDKKIIALYKKENSK